MAYAEAVGKRLPKEFELEYLAKNRGTSEYPSGGEADYETEIWIYGPAGEPASDRLKTLPVFGLHSNVAEWTDSIQTMYPGAGDPGPEFTRMTNLYRNRVVRGGPVTLGPNDRFFEYTHYDNTPAEFLGYQKSGFRNWLSLCPWATC